MMKKDSNSESEKEEKNGKIKVPSEAATPSANYDISVKSPTINSNDSEDSEDNDDPMSLSEIPTSQLDTTVGNSSDEDNENVEECSDANTTVDEGRQTEDTAIKSKKKKRLGTTGPVKNVKSKKPKKSPKKECTVRIKKGSKEEIGDKKKLTKVTRKKEDAKTVRVEIILANSKRNTGTKKKICTIHTLYSNENPILRPPVSFITHSSRTPLHATDQVLWRDLASLVISPPTNAFLLEQPCDLVRSRPIGLPEKKFVSIPWTKCAFQCSFSAFFTYLFVGWDALAKARRGKEKN